MNLEDALKNHGFYSKLHCEYNDFVRLTAELGQTDKENFGERQLISPGLTSTTGNSLSDRYGFGAFPYHTDVAYWPRPARYLALFCHNPGKARRPTFVVDVRRLRFSPTELQVLHKELYRITQSAFSFYTRVFNRQGTDSWVRYDGHCMIPVSSGNSLAILKEKVALHESQEICWESGQMLIIDNKRCLHARGTTFEQDRNRVLERILIK